MSEKPARYIFELPKLTKIQCVQCSLLPQIQENLSLFLSRSKTTFTLHLHSIKRQMRVWIRLKVTRSGESEFTDVSQVRGLEF